MDTYTEYMCFKYVYLLRRGGISKNCLSRKIRLMKWKEKLDTAEDFCLLRYFPVYPFLYSIIADMA